MKIKIFISIFIFIIAILLLFFDLTSISLIIIKIGNFFLNINIINYIIFFILLIISILIFLPYSRIKKVLMKIGNNINKVNKVKFFKNTISLIFFILFIIYFIQNNFKLDLTSISIIVIAFLPWVFNLIKSAKLPGGFEIVFNDIREAQKLVENIPKDIKIRKSKYSFLNILGIDPNIAMAALRVEIETRLREIGKNYNFSEYEPLMSLFRNLRKKEIITEQEFYGMEELIQVGNKAAHGAKINEKVIKWATDYAPIVLGVLDNKINESKKKKKQK